MAVYISIPPFVLSIYSHLGLHIENCCIGWVDENNSQIKIACIRLYALFRVFPL
nr:MAG TPA: hypothetical protein [Caudoviricetes sp.]